MTLEQERDRDWARYEAGYNAARQEAIDQLICFCRCGCRKSVLRLNSFGAPARCEACKKGAKSHHALMPLPAESFDWEKYEPPLPPRPVRPRVSPEQRSAAETYVRKAGHRGFKSLHRLRTRVLDAGHALTDSQTLAALRSKAADERDAGRAATRAVKTDWRMRKNLNRIVIPVELPGGTYAVPDGTESVGQLVKVVIKRRRSGPLAGYTFVDIDFGAGVVQHGFQMPQPVRAGHVQAYQGPSVHLVAKLVANPDEARSNAKQASRLEREAYV